MDLITQAVLGAAVGQAGFLKKLGRRSIGWGAIIGATPDLDVIVHLSSDPFAHIVHHRGITHALWFCVFIAPIFGYGIWRYHKRDSSLADWMWLAFWALITHPLLDLFTVYGTQLLTPFSHHRFSWHAVSVIDPIYTFSLLFVTFLGFLCKKQLLKLQGYAQLALTITTFYLFFGFYQNYVAERFSQNQLKQEHVQYSSIEVYPTILQIFYRRIVVWEADQIRVGFLSTINPKPIRWHILQQPNNMRALEFSHNRDVKTFIWFCNGRCSIRFNEQTRIVQLRDLRFGIDEYSLEGPWGVEFLINDKREILGDIQYKTFRMAENIRLRLKNLFLRMWLGV